MKAGGFSLLELVLSLLLLALGSIVVATQFGQTATALSVDEATQTAAQLAQRCAEHLIETRRRADYASAVAAACPTLPPALAALGYGQSLTATPLSGPPCPTGASCTRMQVQITRNGAPTHTLDLMLTDY